jgi:hypothetical protein
LGDIDAAAELADRERLAVGAVTTTQRLSGSVGRPVMLRLVGGPLVSGTLRTVGPDWLLLSEGQGRDCLVALRAVTTVEGLSAATAPEPGALSLRSDLRRALRGVARDRSPVAIALTGWTGGIGPSGAGVAGPGGSAEITGTIDRVGADFVEIAVHSAWEPRRAGSVRSVALVPIAALMLVRALPLG